MHEVSIANEIINIVGNYLPKDNNNRVKSVKLEIGKFSNILPEALKFGFEVLTSKTELEGAELDIILVPLRIECLNCRKTSTTEPEFLYCLDCGSNEVKIVSGNEMKVVDIEIYD